MHRTPGRGRAAASALLLGLLGCADAPRGRIPESPAAFAHPEPDPSLRGAPQGSRTLLATETVTVRFRRDASGRPTLVEVLSPTLSPEEQRALIRAFDAGEWRRPAPRSPDSETWIENLVRTRP